MAIDEHRLRFEGLLPIARALREQIDWDARARRHRRVAVRPRVLRPARGARRSSRPSRCTDAGAPREPRVRVVTDARFGRRGGGVASRYGSRHDHARAPAPARRAAPRARPRPLRLLQPRPERVRHARRARRPRSTRCSPRPPTRSTRPTGLEHEERQALRADVERVREVLAGGDVAAERHPRPRGLRLRPGRPARGRPPAAPDRVARGGRRRRRASSRSLRGGADASAGACCSSTARSRGSSAAPADGLEEVDHDRGRHARPARPGRLVAGALPALGRAGEAQPPRQHSLDTLFTRFKRQPFDHLVVGAPEELVREVEERLHPYLRERLAGRHRHRRREHVGADEVQAAAAAGRGARTSPRSSARRSTAWPQGVGRGDRGGCRARRRDGGARAGARGDPAAGRGLRRARARRARSRRRSPSRREVLVVRHHDDLVHARRDRRRAALLSGAGARHRRLPERLHAPAARSPSPDGDAIAAADRRARALGRVRPRRRHARLAPARPRLVRRAGRPVAAALRAGHARRRAAPGARPRAASTSSSTRARTRATEGYSGFEATALGRAAARARRRPRHRRRPGDGLLRQEHRARRAAPRLRRHRRLHRRAGGRGASRATPSARSRSCAPPARLDRVRSGHAARAAGSGWSSRPTFAHGRPSTITTSAVKSFAPRISDEPTP